jgi:hypothetical protein
MVAGAGVRHRRHRAGRAGHSGHRACLAKGSNQHPAASGYPQVRLAALVACGTRTMDAVFGPAADGEPAYATVLLRSLRQGMIVLLDRGLSGNDVLAAVTSAKADFLARQSAGANHRSCAVCRGSLLPILAAPKSASSSARSPSPPPPAPTG